MKRNLKKTAIFKSGIALLIVLAVFVVHSCKKNQSVIKSNTTLNEAIDITKLKILYKTDTTAGKLTVMDMGVPSSAMIKDGTVEWDSLRTYQRETSKVFEFELKKPSDLWTFGVPPTKSINKNSVIFLMFNDGTNVNLYMKVIEDLRNGTTSKIKQVHYMSIPNGFNGQVLYYTLNKHFVNGYNYVDGKINGAFIPTDVNNDKQQTLSTRAKKGNEIYFYTMCGEAYNYNYTAGDFENGTWVDSGYQECEYGYYDSGGGYQAGSGNGGYQGDPGGAPGSSNPNISAQQTITNGLANNSSFLLDCDSLTLLQITAYNNYGSMYQNVAGFHPGQSVINRINSLQTNTSFYQTIDNFNLQNLNNAFGSVVNSDFFPVRITTMPTGMNMASLTEYFRLNMTNFTSGLATFSPYNFMGVNDTQLFNQTGAQSVGALVHIGMANDGTIIESDYQNSTNGVYYTYSTMTSPLDFNHPVSGNRQFGIYPDPNNPGSYTFYTMGVDRLSDWQFALGGSIIDAFGAADKLWSAMQINMINYINSHGGNAGFYNKKSYTARPDYDLVKDYLDGKITLEQLKRKIGC
jgi:hypothetical protein